MHDVLFPVTQEAICVAMYLAESLVFCNKEKVLDFQRNVQNISKIPDAVLLYASNFLLLFITGLLDMSSEFIVQAQMLYMFL